MDVGEGEGLVMPMLDFSALDQGYFFTMESPWAVSKDAIEPADRNMEVDTGDAEANEKSPSSEI